MGASKPLRRLAVLVAALLTGGLVGCGVLAPSRRSPGDNELRGVVFLAMGIPNDETIDTELMEGLKVRLAMTLQEFHRIHPQAQVQLQLYSEDRLPQEARLRGAAGTSPDLLLVNDSTAADLHQMGLTRKVRMPVELLRRLDHAAVRRHQSPTGEVSSLPVLLLPQLACFDRRRLPRAPETLDALLADAGRGLRVGLPLDGFNLAWTFGSLGVASSVEELFAGQPATTERRAALGRWLDWLKRADQVPDLNFQLSQSQLVNDLGEGRLDWTSCRSTHLARLRQDLGEHLGIAPLPAGPGGLPTPLSRQRVLAFGRDSSLEQQRVAEAFARFVVRPLTQRNLALQREEVVPVISSLRLPPGRKGTLRLLEFRSGDLQGEAMGRVVSRFLYGDLDQEGAIDGLVRTIQAKPLRP
ncbi:MAG: extracellular solute-binding protein [Cyanobacteria bacterium K_Offshore_surface_m2_239]|nr:extracellular solute-binding protein [Cyanobacteria bacterium K_Offshore_surface_m2_239]